MFSVLSLNFFFKLTGFVLNSDEIFLCVQNIRGCNRFFIRSFS